MRHALVKLPDFKDEEVILWATRTHRLRGRETQLLLVFSTAALGCERRRRAGAGGDADWHSHCGGQCAGCSKNKMRNCLVTQKLHF